MYISGDDFPDWDQTNLFVLLEEPEDCMLSTCPCVKYMSQNHFLIVLFVITWLLQRVVSYILYYFTEVFAYIF